MSPVANHNNTTLATFVDQDAPELPPIERGFQIGATRKTLQDKERPQKRLRQHAHVGRVQILHAGILR